MDAAVENGVCVAMSVHVFVLLCMAFYGRIDALCVHAAHQGRCVEFGV